MVAGERTGEDGGRTNREGGHAGQKNERHKRTRRTTIIFTNIIRSAHRVVGTLHRTFPRSHNESPLYANPHPCCPSTSSTTSPVSTPFTGHPPACASASTKRGARAGADKRPASRRRIAADGRATQRKRDAMGRVCRTRTRSVCTSSTTRLNTCSAGPIWPCASART